MQTNQITLSRNLASQVDLLPLSHAVKKLKNNSVNCWLKFKSESYFNPNTSSSILFFLYFLFGLATELKYARINFVGIFFISDEFWILESFQEREATVKWLKCHFQSRKIRVKSHLLQIFFSLILEYLYEHLWFIQIKKYLFVVKLLIFNE